MEAADVGRYINYVFFGETLTEFEYDGFAGLQSDLSGLTEVVDRLIDDAHAEAREDRSFTGGLTLVVACGVGRACSIS